MSKQERNVVAVPQDLIDRMKRAKEATGTTIAWQVREAIELYLRTKGVLK